MGGVQGLSLGLSPLQSLLHHRPRNSLKLPSTIKCVHSITHLRTREMAWVHGPWRPDLSWTWPHAIALTGGSGHALSSPSSLLIVNVMGPSVPGFMESLMCTTLSIPRDSVQHLAQGHLERRTWTQAVWLYWPFQFHHSSNSHVHRAE